MSELKRYTSQVMREMADCISNIRQSEMPSWKEGEIITGGDLCRSAEMLRQAAQREEDYQNVCAGLKWKDSECENLKARLDAVVKECEKWKWADDNWCASVKDATDMHNRCIDRIVSIARGKEGSYGE